MQKLNLINVKYMASSAPACISSICRRWQSKPLKNQGNLRLQRPGRFDVPMFLRDNDIMKLKQGMLKNNLLTIGTWASISLFSSSCFAPSINNIRRTSSNAPRNILGGLKAGKNYSVSGSPYFPAPLNGNSITMGLSYDSKWVAFTTAGTNWGGNDTNGASDVLVMNLITGEVKHASTNSAGVIGNAGSAGIDAYKPFSPDSRYVIFESTSTNLIVGDTNGTNDCFMKDLVTGTVTRISTSTGGVQIAGASRCFLFSPDGSKVFFLSFASTVVAGDTNAIGDMFMKDLTTDITTRVSTDSLGNEFGAGAYSVMKDISYDGNLILFTSGSTNVVPGDTNAETDLFMKNLTTGAVERISVATGGAEGTAGDAQEGHFNSDATKVAFQSAAAGLAAPEAAGFRDIFIRDMAANTTITASLNESGAALGSHIYWARWLDANRIVMHGTGAPIAGDTNALRDIFIKDLSNQDATLVNASTTTGTFVTAGHSWNPFVAANGSYIIYETASAEITEGGDTNGMNDLVIYIVP